MEHVRDADGPRVHRTGDRGDIVLGWLTKLVVILSVVGILGFDLIAIGQAHIQASDRAGTAARAAAEAYSSSKNVQTAYDAAFATLTDGDTIPPTTFVVAQDGSVDLRLNHSAVTLFVHRIGPLASQADVSSTGKAGAVR